MRQFSNARRRRISEYSLRRIGWWLIYFAVFSLPLSSLSLLPRDSPPVFFHPLLQTRPMKNILLHYQCWCRLGLIAWLWQMIVSYYVRAPLHIQHAPSFVFIICQCNCYRGVLYSSRPPSAPPPAPAPPRHGKKNTYCESLVRGCLRRIVLPMVLPYTSVQFVVFYTE